MNPVDNNKNKRCFFNTTEPIERKPKKLKIEMEKEEANTNFQKTNSSKSIANISFLPKEVILHILTSLPDKRGYNFKQFNKTLLVSKQWKELTDIAKVQWINSHPDISLYNIGLKSCIRVLEFVIKNRERIQSLNLKGLNSLSKEDFKILTNYCPNLKSLFIDSIKAVNLKFANKVKVGASRFIAKRCKGLGHVDARESVDIDNCSDISSISAGFHVKLSKSLVLGNVSSGGGATIQNSSINGTLSCYSNNVVINGSTIDTIDLRCSRGISIRRCSSGISIRSGAGGMSFSVGNFFGVNVVSMRGGNIMIGSGTNPNDVSINGVPLSQHLSQQLKEEKKEGIKQVLKLRNCTVKNVIFEGGNGEVILSGGSSLTGSITGGKMKS